jgi:DNA polymerase III subunit beta
MRINRRLFYGALHELIRIADPKAVQPILRHVLLQARDGLLTLRTTDLTQSLTCQLPAEGELDTCLPAKLLANLVKPEGKGGAGEVTLEPLIENKVSIRLDGVSTSLPGMPSSEFPAPLGAGLEWNPLADWPAKPLHDALSFVLPATSNDPTRPHLQGVFFDLDKMVATDGHRMHIAPLPAPISTPLLIPSSSAMTLVRIICGEQEMVSSVAKGHLRVCVGPWILETMFIDATFPDYHRVLPDKESMFVHLTVEARSLSKALLRLARLSQVKETTVRVNGVMSLRTCDLDMGEAEVVVPTLDNNHEGEDFVIAFNRNYLREAISGDRIVLGFSAPVGSTTHRPGG